MQIEERETEETLFIRLKDEYEKEIKASEIREKFLTLTGDEYKREVEEERREAEERRKGIIGQIIHEAAFKETSDLFLHPIPDFRDYLSPTSSIIRAIEIIDKARTFLNLSENETKLKSAIAIIGRGYDFFSWVRRRAINYSSINYSYFLNIKTMTYENPINIYDVNERFIVSEVNLTASHGHDLRNYEIYAVLAISLAWMVLQFSTDNKFNDPDMPVWNMTHLQDATHLLFEAQKLYDKFLLEEKELSKQIATNRAYTTNSKKLNENRKRNEALEREAEDIVKTNPKLKSRCYSIAEKIQERIKENRLKNIELEDLNLSKDQIARLLKEMSD